MSHGRAIMVEKSVYDLWRKLLAVPEKYSYTPRTELVKSYEYDYFNAELYIQNNGPGTTQRVLITLPQKIDGRLPAVVVPFYHPEAMVGFELDTEEVIELYSEIAMSRYLTERGFITITADAYYLTYCPEDHSSRLEFQRWHNVGTKLMQDYPEWCGCGKLLADTQLLIDMLEKDPRVDADRIGITGHSLGGKMAFYTGCMDERVKVIMASDFGFNWNQSNWHEKWYWGDKIEYLKKSGMDHSQLLDIGQGKPFMLLAGAFDNMASFEAMQKSAAYKNNPEDLVFLNHATGHQPPLDVLDKGFDFLEKYLKSTKK